MQTIALVPRRFRRARLNARNSPDYDPFLTIEDTNANPAKSSWNVDTTEFHRLSLTDSHHVRHRQNSDSIRPAGRFGRRTWRFGLHTGLYASIAVFLGNVAILAAGLAGHDNTFKGITTIAKGDMKRITTISTAYHVLINVLSTILLTSSNYAMQILCAPTRQEVDRAHARGQWLEIGIMSIRNLRHIDRRRAVLWALLAISSAPLHLFYNSSVFSAYAAQDHEVTLTMSRNETQSAAQAWKILSNKDWSNLYASSWVPGYGDLHLLVDSVSFEVLPEKDWTYSLRAPEGINCGWTPVWLRNETLEMNFNTNASFATFNVTTPQKSRFIVEVEDYWTNHTQFPELKWQGPWIIKANGSQTLHEILGTCKDEDGWLSPFTAFHVQHAYAKVNSYANRAQIAIPFLSIVMVSNLIKIIGIFFAIRMRSAGHIITVGDAIATFLEHPEAETKGKCTLNKDQLCSSKKKQNSKPWRVVKKSLFIVLGGTRLWSGSIVVTVFSVTMVAVATATSPGRDLSSWGTSSKSIVSFTSTTFDTRGLLIVAFLANLPQVCLSLLYFSINRICTSVCFALEWNRYATHRKGLRVTDPVGKQRSTHFLQLPYRWAIPLTVTSGLLHWLLSQSLFLARQELRTRDDELYPGSTCACGYSAQSLLAFALVFIALLIAVLYWLLRGMDIHIPPARHCSLVISAACHPPEDDVDAHLAEVKWGVTVVATEEYIGHCTFTSGLVESVQPGALYE